MCHWGIGRSKTETSRQKEEEERFKSKTSRQKEEEERFKSKTFDQRRYRLRCFITPI